MPFISASTSSVQFWKAYEPSDFSDSDVLTDAIPVQPENADEPIDVALPRLTAPRMLKKSAESVKTRTKRTKKFFRKAKSKWAV